MADNFALFGRDLFGDAIHPVRNGALSVRFEFPPFSVLNAREGEWQKRKQAWISTGIKSEVGRGAVCYQIGDKAKWDESIKKRNRSAPGGSLRLACDYSNKERGDGVGRQIKRDGLIHKGATVDTKHGDKWDGGRPAWQNEGTSIFDPVLCELMYRWFCPAGGQIVDPFAGGSVRGIVAGLLGYKYWGCDLRQEQIDANEEQRAIAQDAAIAWVCGDALDCVPQAPRADFVFSCPPYGDLERYSDDPKDLSTMEYHTFIANYKRIILRCYQQLKDDRLACFVVGDFRDKRTGNYRGFVADTINAFREVGFGLYNDAILITAVGSLPVRVSGQFDAGRKLGKTHQNVLVFAKGNPKKAFGNGG